MSSARDGGAGDVYPVGKFYLSAIDRRGTADGVTKNPGHLVVELTPEELTLLCEALDSHVYWQLSDRHYRNSGYVHEPGSDDADAAGAIRTANALEEKLRAIEREMGLRV
jgi:hypothetical protein